ncbi:dTDP-4-dehydrorhamnose 3,5-epimerase [Candidatus Saccharibacteria bacterium]|nr:MAG: dTDP-4-dehydrorhamnose 3,5-epimerase [Candidatus Saccharibacteria bacterium]
MSFNPDDYNALSVTEADIPGMFVVKLPVHGDSRGWFKENYQKEKMEALGLPTFEVVQNNFSYNDQRGVTRGLHAEPWEKYISVANGSVFGAWIDLRAGDSFGQTFSIEITPGVAVFVPRGVANGYQTLEENVTYTYLVNAHWSPDVQYVAVNSFDPAIDIQWPFGREEAIVSEKDRSNPLLANVKPMEI